MAAEPAGRLGAIALGETSVERIRAFFGLPLPEEHRDALGRFLAPLATSAPQFRWTPAANLHFTVRFLGHVEATVAGAMADRLASAGLSGFEAQLGELGTFKRGRLARVVWIGLRHGEDAMRAVAERAEAEAVSAGLEPEGRRFSAHLTLARARPRDGAALPELGPLPTLSGWRAGELVLYRSRLGRAGSVYEPLRTIQLS